MPEMNDALDKVVDILGRQIRKNKTCLLYTSGQRNMFPTAISEIIESGVKLILGLTFAYLVMKFGMFCKRCGEKITNQKGCSVAERDAGIPVIVVAAVKETIS